VLKFDPESEKISLGLKQILPDPWQHVEEKYAVGEIVSGQVTRVVPFGAFVQLDEGIEGVIPTAELAQERVGKPEDVVAVDDTVQTKIVSIRPGERRMTLSLRQVQQDKERQEYKEYQARQHEASRVTLGDLVGDVLAQHAQPAPPEPPADEDTACSSSDSQGESPAEKAESPTSSE
jgi:small subunit ribosomal protein S1